MRRSPRACACLTSWPAFARGSTTCGGVGGEDPARDIRDACATCGACEACGALARRGSYCHHLARWGLFSGCRVWRPVVCGFRSRPSFSIFAAAVDPPRREKPTCFHESEVWHSPEAPRRRSRECYAVTKMVSPQVECLGDLLAGCSRNVPPSPNPRSGPFFECQPSIWWKHVAFSCRKPGRAADLRCQDARFAMHGATGRRARCRPASG